MISWFSLSVMSIVKFIYNKQLFSVNFSTNKVNNREFSFSLFKQLYSETTKSSYNFCNVIKPMLEIIGHYTVFMMLKQFFLYRPGVLRPLGTANLESAKTKFCFSWQIFILLVPDSSAVLAPVFCTLMLSAVHQQNFIFC